ncbi:Ribosomal protein S9/S16 [Musa troglodytarum]|uniref:Ribosomal protein S9/S16 n=1 Tax=Musa troglodytarum TaxID=320322 RepID=A0A9E7I9T8_9LILI|nr:Ribosomal protein S9/S16 [Musa troglodytarum]
MNSTSTRAEIERKKREEAAKAWVRLADEKGRAYGTGRRKCSVARVWIQPGDGKLAVNEKQYDAYFPILDHRFGLSLQRKLFGLWDVDCTVEGGGVSAGYLTRDPRVVERKTAKARKSFRCVKR